MHGRRGDLLLQGRGCGAAVNFNFNKTTKSKKEKIDPNHNQICFVVFLLFLTAFGALLFDVFAHVQSSVKSHSFISFFTRVYNFGLGRKTLIKSFR